MEGKTILLLPIVIQQTPLVLCEGEGVGEGVGADVGVVCRERCVETGLRCCTGVYI